MDLETLATGAGGAGVFYVFATLVKGGFDRRKDNASAEVTSGTAWKSVMADKDRDIDRLYGEVTALREEVSKLQRQNIEHAYWQARVIAREDVVQALLAAQGISVPSMPEPPAAREFRTRAEDRHDPAG